MKNISGNYWVKTDETLYVYGNKENTHHHANHDVAMETLLAPGSFYLHLQIAVVVSVNEIIGYKLAHIK